MSAFIYAPSGSAQTSGSGFVVFPQGFVNPYISANRSPNAFGCGTAEYCQDVDGHGFCVTPIQINGAFVPAITVCQNLWLLNNLAV